MQTIPGGEELSLTTVIDITERKKTERLKDDFLGMVSHELRTPMTIIGGSLQTVLTEGAKLSPVEVRGLIEGAYEASQELSDITENLLELSRARANRLTIHREPVQLEAIARQIVRRLSDHSSHRFVIDIPADLSPIKADPLRVFRVLFNLVHNATKYAPGGTEIRIFARRDGNQVTVGVEDHGPGIPKEARDRLFQAFERLPPQKSGDVPKGTGLGLVVCQRLVEAHGGKIWIESEPGKGATFLFSLPVDGETAGAPR